MKAFVVVLVLSFVAFSQQQDDKHKEFLTKMKANGEACIKETGAKQADVKNAWHDNQFANDKNLKCYFKCMFQKMGLMSDAGVVNLDTMKSHIPQHIDQTQAVAAIDKCKDSKGADACETAFDVAKCLREAYGKIKHD